jgi:hypothetical protein
LFYRRELAEDGRARDEARIASRAATVAEANRRPAGSKNNFVIQFK